MTPHGPIAYLDLRAMCPTTAYPSEGGWIPCWLLRGHWIEGHRQPSEQAALLYAQEALRMVPARRPTRGRERF